MHGTKIKNFCSSSLWTCLHHMVILRSQNKITDFLKILAWLSPFKWQSEELQMAIITQMCWQESHINVLIATPVADIFKITTLKFWSVHSRSNVNCNCASELQLTTTTQKCWQVSHLRRGLLIATLLWTAINHLDCFVFIYFTYNILYSLYRWLDNSRRAGQGLSST